MSAESLTRPLFLNHQRSVAKGVVVLAPSNVPESTSKLVTLSLILLTVVCKLEIVLVLDSAVCLAVLAV